MGRIKIPWTIRVRCGGGWSNLALLCLVLYSLRGIVVTAEELDSPMSSGSGSSSSSLESASLFRRRSTTSTTTPSPSEAPSGPSGPSGPSPVWRRRQMIHMRRQTSTSTTESPAVLIDHLPADFINLASNSNSGSEGDSRGDTDYVTMSPSPSFYPTATNTPKIYADPFMLQGDDNILGPTPGKPRRKIFRRTRRRRLKKLRLGGDSSSTTGPSASAPEGDLDLTGPSAEPTAPSGTFTSSSQEPVTGEDETLTAEDISSSGTTGPSGSGGVSETTHKFQYLFPSTTSGTTFRPTQRLTPTSSFSTTTKLSVVPLDSLMEGGGKTEEATSSLLPTTGTGTSALNLRPGFYTQPPSTAPGRKRAKSKENLWPPNPNFSVELFDNTDVTDESQSSNVLKRENKIPPNLFLPKPTALSGFLPTGGGGGGVGFGGDQSTGESVHNSYVNTSLPISTELQNSLQFTLQVLHPLLNGDGNGLAEGGKTAPENKTVAITHTLAESPQDTPVAPDLRFLPAHLRKSHPLLSEESFFDGGGGGFLGGGKTGPRLNVMPTNVRYNNRPVYTPTTTSKTTPITSTSTTRRYTTPPLATTSKYTPPATPPTTTTERKPSSSAVVTTTPGMVSISPPVSKAYPTQASPSPPFPPASSNVHLEQLGNLKITEIVYPTNAAPPPGPPPGGNLNLRGYMAPPQRSSPPAPIITSTSTKGTTTTSKTTTTTFRTSTAASTTSTSTPKSTSTVSTSGRPATPVFERDLQNPPMIYMGSDSAHIGSAIESPPAFDDLLLEELVKGFEPPKPSTTTTTTTTPKTTTTTTRRTTTTTTTTSTPPTPPSSSSLSPPNQLDETQQLIQLLNLLQPSAPSPTPEGLQSLSTSSSSSTTLATSPDKLNDEFLKNLALLENLLSPTAKTAIKTAVDTGTTKHLKPPSPSIPSPISSSSSAPSQQQGLSNSDLHQIFQLLDAMSTSTPKPPPPPTTTTTKPPQVIHPALQNMLNLLSNPSNPSVASSTLPQQPLFSIPSPPKPVPTSSSFDLLSQLFNLNQVSSQPATPRPSVASTLATGLGGIGGALGGLFESFLPKKTPTNRDASSSASTNPLLSFFQTPQEPVQTPAPGPYYWFDVNAFLGQDPNKGPMSGIRPKFGSRDYFLKVRKRRNSMEAY